METTEQNQQEPVDTLSIARLGITTELEHARLQYESERDNIRLEHEKEIETSRRQHEKDMETRRIKLEMVKVSTETLTDNAKSKPVTERQITAEDIKTLADELVQYINGNT
jgi:hypothetical protein